MSAPALWTKHRTFALSLAREFRIPGSERQDVEQEALIGLWVAARGYDREAGPFPSFARLVIRRRLASLVRAALRDKHAPLSESVRVRRDEDGSWVAIADEIPGGADPAEVVVELESFRRLVAAVGSLTPLEREALLAVVNGTFQDGRLDNAAYRARRKLRAAA